MKRNYNKKINELLNNPPEFPMQEAHWEAMEERLNQAAVNPPINYLEKYAWLLLWLFSFLLLGGIAWFQIDQANQQIALLQAELKKKNTVQSDTIFNHFVINQYDTIYYTTTVYNKVIQHTMESPNSAIATYPLSTASEDFNQINLPKWNRLHKNFFSETSFQQQPITSLGDIQQVLYGSSLAPVVALRYNEEAIKQALPKADIVGLKALDIPLRAIDLFDYFELPAPVYKKEINPLVYLQPTGFKLGVEGSLLKLISIQGEDKKGFTVGLSTEINFGKNVSMFIGGEYLKLQYELEDEDDISAYPSVEPQNNQDLFHSLKVQSRYLQVPFGFKYKFRADKKIRPYLGVGVIARKPLKLDLEYEFKNNRRAYEVSRTYNAEGFSINTARGDVGFEYTLTKRWNFYMEGTYDFDFRNSEYGFERINYLNLKTGVFYKF